MPGCGVAVPAPLHRSAPSSDRGSPCGKMPSGHPLAVPVEQVDPAAQRVVGAAAPRMVSAVWVCCSIRKFSTATGVGAAPDPSPKISWPPPYSRDRAVGGELLERVRLLGVRGGDDVALVVLGQGEQAEHLVHVLPLHPDGGGDLVAGVAPEVDVAHVGAHRGELLEHPVDRLDVAGGEQVGEVLDRDAQRVDRPEEVVDVLGVVAGVLDDVDDRRQRRDVPDHRHRAVLRVQRQRHLVVHDQLLDRAAAGRLDPVTGDAGRLRRAPHLGVLGVEEAPPSCDS